MNSEIKKRWTAALTGGEYKQTDCKLEGSSGFCCLGVLCHLAFLEGVVKRMVNNGITYGSQHGVLPIEVVEWAGLRDEDPHVNEHSEEFGELETQLTHLNDSGVSFNRIAEMIDKSL